MAAQLSQCNQGQPVDGEQSMAKKAKEESPTKLLQAKIARKDSLIRKWKREAQGCDDSDFVGRAVKR